MSETTQIVLFEDHGTVTVYRKAGTVDSPELSPGSPRRFATLQRGCVSQPDAATCGFSDQRGAMLSGRVTHYASAAFTFAIASSISSVFLYPTVTQSTPAFLN